MDSRFETHKICVVVPTYNNDRTLKRVLDGVLAITENLIVINDGSSDSTRKILETQYSQVRQIHFEKNRGKGLALRKGFAFARVLGYEHSISIDSDGQHFPSDLRLFVDELLENGPGIIIGSRDLTQEGVPGKSNFGNRFSNFWFKLETGIQLSDTQSGFRLYPIKELEKLRFFTSKFEFEIEVIVKAAWKGLSVRNIPVQVLYDPTERVSHFRPFTDFARISLLNTYLVVVSLFRKKAKKKDNFL